MSTFVTPPMDYPLKLAAQLRPQLQALRRKQGLTQAQLGAAIGVTQARVVEIEANPGVVNLQQIMQVLNALGASLMIRENEKGERQGADGLRPAEEDAGEPAPGRSKKGSW